MAPQNTKASLFFSFLASASILTGSMSHASSSSSPRTVSSRQQVNCRCTLVSRSDHSSLTSTNYQTYRNRPTSCELLGPQLERWRRHDSKHWKAFLAESFEELDDDDVEDMSEPGSAPSYVAHAPRPIQTDVLVEASRRRSEDGIIICKPMSSVVSESVMTENAAAFEMDRWAPNRGSFVLGGFVVLLVLGILAEVVEMMMFRSSLVRRKQPIVLSGSEKSLTMDEESPVFEAYPDQSDDEWIDEKPII